MCILELFNDSDDLSLQDIAFSIGIPKELVLPTLEGFVKHQLLLETSEKIYKNNPNFGDQLTSSKLKIL
jgi:hypothetical protein